jgi:hypothetical protein
MLAEASRQAGLFLQKPMGGERCLLGWREVCAEPGRQGWGTGLSAKPIGLLPKDEPILEAQQSIE